MLNPLLSDYENISSTESKKHFTIYILLGLFTPCIMLISAFMWFIPRNPDYYGNPINPLKMLYVGISWIIPAWIIYFLSVYISNHYNLPFKVEKSQKNQINDIIEYNHNLPTILNRYSPICGLSGYVIFFLSSTFMFLYFEIQYGGWYLEHYYELLEYPITLIPFLTLAYLSRKYIPSLLMYTLTWSVWGILWDSTVPGFVYVPNLYTWHQWSISVLIGRLIIDG